MTPADIAWWWCCLSDAQRSTLQALYTLYLLTPPATLRTAYDAVLLAGYYPRDTPQYDYFSSEFQISFETVVIEGVDVDVAIFDTTFWVAFDLFARGVGFDCPEPCYILKFALEHL